MSSCLFLSLSLSLSPPPSLHPHPHARHHRGYTVAEDSCGARSADAVSGSGWQGLSLGASLANAAAIKAQVLSGPNPWTPNSLIEPLLFHRRSQSCRGGSTCTVPTVPIHHPFFFFMTLEARVE